jgi:pimeloyl-ACP methyl ester carboxylesterase
MRVHVLLAALLTASLAAASFAASTSNLAREKGYAEQITDQLVVGEAVWLQAAGTRFLGLYTAPEGAHKDSKNAVILVHGRGVHPSWGFIETLRMELPAEGFHTLSLQMPILEEANKLADYARTFPEAYDRLDAGVALLKRKGIARIFLIGHSSGAMTVIAYGAERPAAAVSGIAAIGAGSDAAGGPRMQPPRMLEQIKSKPVLDIYGEKDLDIVLNPASARAAAAQRAGNRGFRQARVAGADHFFTNHYDELKAQLLGWLKPFAR